MYYCITVLFFTVRVPNRNAIAIAIAIFNRNGIFDLLRPQSTQALLFNFSQNINFESSASEIFDDPRRPRLLDEVNQDDGEIDVPGQPVRNNRSQASELIEAIEPNDSVRLLGVKLNY